ncbi:hypothetical protein LPB03_06275 [Polaribacter vadi]|uniref:Lacal_2735 family protein n=1 Tax=Polaribacter vadi TaxID=1774273 RepID=A0A1B8TZA9_9FLAO|nr:hypothetical protein [Polaribacter vadi]AOW17090.1 hypothetical protein LPB03_06275 [Polaribacter vadi]OBY64981.1 hypothetical protein LPB3_06210 [Polaribacter vadi]|tara:strand:+ start:610 stop:804 length:195 start_codon:yes stop_codon:yes gene_type:complete
MSRLLQLEKYKNHLQKSYVSLVEKSNNYRFLDESISDVAAFKAMKLLEKLNQVYYLDQEIQYSN